MQSNFPLHPDNTYSDDDPRTAKRVVLTSSTLKEYLKVINKGARIRNERVAPIIRNIINNL